jgi:hypothetical protein
MTTQEIRIRVDPTAAEHYLSATPARRIALDAMLSLYLSSLAQERQPLADIIREASAEAETNGLTKEILAEILAEKQGIDRTIG